jgi:hypothetical protein
MSNSVSAYSSSMPLTILKMNIKNQNANEEYVRQQLLLWLFFIYLFGEGHLINRQCVMCRIYLVFTTPSN